MTRIEWKRLAATVGCGLGVLGGTALAQGDAATYRALKVGEARVAVDYDGDLVVDDVAIVDVVALDKARRDGKTSRDATEKQGTNPKATLSGKIKSKNVTKLGDGQPVCVVKLEDVSVDGEKPADEIPSEILLGPKGEFGRLTLERGESLEVTGRCGRLDGRKVVVAEAVRQDDQTVRVVPPRTTVRMFAGTIENMESKSFASHDGDFVIAGMKMADGRSLRVNLGRKEKLSKLDLTDGDKIELLARRGQIDGEPALIAQQVRFEGMKKKVSPPTSAGGKNDRQGA